MREVIRYDKRGADAGLRRVLAARRRAPGAPVRIGPTCPTDPGARRRWRCWRARPSGRASRTVRARDYLYHARFARAPDRPRGRAAPRPGRPARRRCAPGLTGARRRGRARRRRWLGERGLAGELHRRSLPGSIWGTKRWPYYPALAASVDGPDRGDRRAGTTRRWPMTIVAARAGRARSAAGALSLRASAALIAPRARARHQRFGPAAPGDRGRHAVVAIFGPTAPEQGFGPRGGRSLALGHAAWLPALLGTWAGGVPAGSSPMHAGAGVETVARRWPPSRKRRIGVRFVLRH